MGVHHQARSEQHPPSRPPHLPHTPASRGFSVIQRIRTTFPDCYIELLTSYSNANPSKGARLFFHVVLIQSATSLLCGAIREPFWERLLKIKGAQEFFPWV